MLHIVDKMFVRPLELPLSSARVESVVETLEVVSLEKTSGQKDRGWKSYHKRSQIPDIEVSGP